MGQKGAGKEGGAGDVEGMAKFLFNLRVVHTGSVQVTDWGGTMEPQLLLRLPPDE